MPYGRSVAFLLPDEPLGERLIVFAMLAGLGVWMIHVGRLNVRARLAEESGKRGLFHRLLGRPKVLEGRAAVAMGWLRIATGAAAILFGLVFLLFGAFLKD